MKKYTIQSIFFLGIATLILVGSINIKSRPNKAAQGEEIPFKGLNPDTLIERAKYFADKSPSGSFKEDEIEELSQLVDSINTIKDKQILNQLYSLILLPLEQTGQYMQIKHIFKKCRDQDIDISSAVISRNKEFLVEKKKDITVIEWIYAQELLEYDYPENLKVDVFKKIINKTSTEIDIDYVYSIYNRVKKSLHSNESQNKLKGYLVGRIIEMGYIGTAEGITKDSPNIVDALSPFHLFKFGKGLLYNDKMMKAMRMFNLLKKKYPDSLYNVTAKKTISKYVPSFK